MYINSRNILIFIGLLFTGLVVWYFSGIVFSIIIAVIVALLGEPVKNFYKRIHVGKYKISDTPATFLALFTFAIILLLVFSLFIPLVIKEARIISSISPQDVIVSFREPISKIETFFASFNITNTTPINITENIRSAISSFLSFANLSSFANSFVGTISNFMVFFFSVAFISFFFLKDRNMFPDFIIMLTPEKHVEAIRKIMNRSKEMLRRYFLAVIIQSLAVSLLIFVGLLIVGVENALIIAFLSGILNIIPYVGPLIAAFIGLIIGVSTNLELDFYSAMIPFSLKILAVFLSVQFIDNFFLQPYIFSNTVNAHPLEIFIVILMAGTLAGITGMIAAIPAYSMLRIIAGEFLSNFKIVRSLTDKEIETQDDNAGNS